MTQLLMPCGAVVATGLSLWAHFTGNSRWLDRGITALVTCVAIAVLAGLLSWFKQSHVNH
jgi:hypothetical protein